MKILLHLLENLAHLAEQITASFTVLSWQYVEIPAAFAVSLTDF